MILKGIKLEGRVRIYLITLVFFIAGMNVWALPNDWLKLGAIVLLFATYVYTTSYIGKKFATKNAQQKCKEVHKND